MSRLNDKRLVGVQAARGMAALMVVIYHTTRSVSLPQYLGHIPFGNAFGFGHAGVDFFFVLSGFIITYAHAADIGRPERSARYVWRRITRIYPLYWMVTFIAIITGLFAVDAATRLAPRHVALSLLLLPEAADPVVGVAWTLRSEMLFYLAFALPILNRRFGWPLGIAAVFLVVTGAVVSPSGVWPRLLCSSFNIEFLMGIAAARWLAARRVSFPTAFVVIGAAYFLTVGILEVQGFVPLNGLMGRLLYGTASVAILLGLVELERCNVLRPGPIGLLMGDTSYVLYLIHLTVIPLTVRATAKFGVLAMLPTGITVIALASLAVLAAILLHIGIERPIMRFIRRHTPRSCR